VDEKAWQEPLRLQEPYQRGPSAQVGALLCEELGVSIISGVLSMDHVHMFISIPPHRAVSDVMRRIKGRTSRKVQMEFPDLKKKYWGRHFWARGYFCTTSGAVNEETILQYIEKHTPNSTGISR
jgi:putative transposase